MKLKTTALTGFLTAVAMLASPNAKAAAPADDGQIMTILTTANKGEIQAGQAAEKKAMNAEVKSFASHMVSEHAKNQKEGETLAKKLGVKPMPADKAAALEKDAQAKMAALNAKSGKDFDKAYIDSQVEMHTMVLSELDTNLIPAAKNAELKTFLNTTKAHVTSHLETAKKLQASMK
jgi:putative membrane protein